MTGTTVEVPEEVLALLEQSRLGRRSRQHLVRLALAMHLFHEGLVSVGRAAELAGEPRASFELLLGDLGVPPARLDDADYRGSWSPAASPAPSIPAP